MYAPANQPPDFYYNVNDSRQKLTAWVGLCRNGDMLGPFFFSGNVNEQSYLNLLNDEVVPLMTVLSQNQFHENQFQRWWWAQGLAPCHELLAVRARPNQVLEKELKVYIIIPNGLQDLLI